MMNKKHVQKPVHLNDTVTQMNFLFATMTELKTTEIKTKSFCYKNVW